jgi:sec-independent protein translocase protein TatA
MKLIGACGRLQSMHTIALVTPGPTEWVLILVIVLVLFGAKKLPELARSLGQSMNEFRKAREEFDRELHQAGQDLKAPPQNTQPYQPAQQVPPPSQPAPVQTAQSQPPTQQPTQPS